MHLQWVQDPTACPTRRLQQWRLWPWAFEAPEYRGIPFYAFNPDDHADAGYWSEVDEVPYVAPDKPEEDDDL